MEHLTQQQQFAVLVDWLRGAMSEPEAFSLAYNAEASEFIRFNHGKVRQAGHVQQASLNFKLINDGRHADLHLTLSGDAEVDQARLSDALQQLRETVVLLPQDPYLLPNTDHWQISNIQDQPLPDSAHVLAQISELAEGLDLVGFYAAGPQGFRQFLGCAGLASGEQFQLRLEPVSC